VALPRLPSEPVGRALPPGGPGPLAVEPDGADPKLVDVSDRASEKNAPGPAANLIFRETNRTSFVPASYATPLDSRPDGKIVVFALPKSGNVWLVSLLCDYTGLPPIDPVAEVDRRGAGMCHFPYAGFMAQRADFLHAVYLVRDIRDVIVSYFHNAQTEWFKDGLPNFYYDTIEQFYFEWFLTRVVQVHQIHTHADAYLDFGVPAIQYERLCEEPEREFARLIKRLGLPYDADRIRECVAQNRIENLRARGRMLDKMVPPTHFRKGGHGHYKNELPATVLQHATEEFRSLIVRWGYPI
jgi:Sulfotransferase domain